MPIMAVLTFQNGSKNGFTRCINITILDGKSYEGDSNFTVTWAADSSVRLGTSVTSITIQENES